MKTAFSIFFLLTTLPAQAGEIGLCKGSVLQRRLALVQLGQIVEDYVLAKGELPDICVAPVAGISDKIPDLLMGASICGSSNEGAVYYSCRIPSRDSPVIESCRYSLADQSMSCENRTMVTKFE